MIDVVIESLDVHFYQPFHPVPEALHLLERCVTGALRSESM